MKPPQALAERVCEVVLVEVEIHELASGRTPPSELRALAQALCDLASDLCERAGRVAE